MQENDRYSNVALNDITMGTKIGLAQRRHDLMDHNSLWKEGKSELLQLKYFVK